jgi:hypothetical protein
VSEPSDVDALFKLPLGEFTAARNALSAQLKKAGRQPEAAEVKALTKPSVSAWVVNQLYWRHRALFDRLVDAGERLRRAQLTGGSTREAIDARREAVAKLAGIAEALLRDGNSGATRDLLRRVTTTLEALASYHSLPGAPIAGRLVDDVEPPGFDALAGLLPPAAAKPPPRTEKPGPAKKRDDENKRDDKDSKRLLAAAKAAVREAERTLSGTRKQAERAAAESDAAAARAKATEADRAQLERKLDLATQAAAVADERARKAAASAREAATAADGAERAVELARRDVQQFGRT